MEFQIRGPSRPPSWLVFLPGGACILLGVLIMVVPDLLEAIVATALIVVGLTLISLATRLRAPGGGGPFGR